MTPVTSADVSSPFLRSGFAGSKSRGTQMNLVMFSDPATLPVSRFPRVKLRLGRLFGAGFLMKNGGEPPASAPEARHDDPQLDVFDEVPCSPSTALGSTSTRVITSVANHG